MQYNGTFSEIFLYLRIDNSLSILQRYRLNAAFIPARQNSYLLKVIEALERYNQAAIIIN